MIVEADPEGRSQLKRNSQQEDENQNRVALPVFRTDGLASPVGSARITSAAVTAQETAPFDNAGT